MKAHSNKTFNWSHMHFLLSRLKLIPDTSWIFGIPHGEHGSELYDLNMMFGKPYERKA